ncbi:MAG: GGDEF domain-containing protein [Candidatus Nanopelagicales bacterium]
MNAHAREPASFTAPEAAAPGLTAAVAHRLALMAALVTVAAIVLAVLVIVSELIPSGLSFLPGNWCDMSMLSALCVALLGGSVLCSAMQTRGFKFVGTGLALGVVAVVIGSSLGFIGTKSPTGEAECGALSQVNFERISDPAAVWLGGFAVLVLLSMRYSHLWGRAGAILAVLLLLGAYVIMFAQVFAAASLIDLGRSSTSAYVSACLALLLAGWALFQLAFNRWRLVTSSTIAGRMLRQSVPFLLLVPVVVALFAYLTVEWTHLTSAGVLTIAVALTAVILFVVMLRLARVVDRIEGELRARAHSDALTGLANRWALELLADQLMSQAKRLDKEVSAIYFDLDGLKAVNDTAGHDSGSAILMDFASVVAGEARNGEIAARLGGDEFAMLMIADAAQAAQVLARVRDAVAGRNTARGFPIPFSAGIATSSPDVPLENLLDEADRLMYRDKAARRSADGSKITGFPARSTEQGE